MPGHRWQDVDISPSLPPRSNSSTPVLPIRPTSALEPIGGLLQAGAVGFILKDSGPALLAEAVRAAHTGDAMVSPAITMRLLEQFAGTGKRALRKPTTPLTEREVQLVTLLARGRTNQEIAQELYVSLGRVKAHVGNVQDKLQLRNRTEIAAWAWENRLVTQT